MKNELVLITGSSKGLGEELALTFARNGHDIILHGRNESDLIKVKKNIDKFGICSEIVYGDLKNKKTIQSLYKIAKEKDIYVLINNAGVFCPGIPFEELSDKQIQDIFETNLYAPIKLSRKIYPLFAEKNFGTIININSIIGLESKKFRSVSCACKYGLRGFTDSLRLEAIDKKISILGVYPTRIKTHPGMENAMEPEYVAKKIYSAYKSGIEELILDGRKK